MIRKAEIAAMEHPQTKPPLPAEYYRRHAVRVRQLANEATTSAVKEHLQDIARQYERLADRVDVSDERMLKGERYP